MIEKICARLEELIDKSFSDALKGYTFASARNGAYQEAKKIVQEVAKEYGNGWIPCSERFPKEYVSVLVCDREGDIYVALMYDTKIYGKIWRQWNGGELRLDWVIAWQPLPAPYQKSPSRCDTCTHYVADEVPPICYMCSKGIEDNYERKGE